MGPGSWREREEAWKFQSMLEQGQRKEAGGPEGMNRSVMISPEMSVLRRPITGTAILIHESGVWTWIWLADMQSQEALQTRSCLHALPPCGLDFPSKSAVRLMCCCRNRVL